MSGESLHNAGENLGSFAASVDFNSSTLQHKGSGICWFDLIKGEHVCKRARDVWDTEGQMAWSSGHEFYDWNGSSLTGKLLARLGVQELIISTVYNVFIHDRENSFLDCLQIQFGNPLSSASFKLIYRVKILTSSLFTTSFLEPCLL